MQKPFEPNESLSLNCRGRLLSLAAPKIMGILNLTPDSFSDGGQYNEFDAALERVGVMIEEGADIIDIGGYSSRPYAEDVSPQQELDRIAGIGEAILKNYPQCLLSVDTFRAAVAKNMLESGAHIINDISGGQLDPAMWSTLLHFGDVPYILMHMQGRPQDMQENPQYVNVLQEIQEWLAREVQKAREAGLIDVVIDPGFGFGKEIKHNYQILGGLEHLVRMNVPLLVGISRKSMLYKLFKTTPDDVLELTSALHLKALEKGAHILRVHDVKAAKRISELYLYQKENGIIHDWDRNG
ncbi:MAG: dihydropteroate synthase [Bacteroidota bacterium]